MNKFFLGLLAILLLQFSNSQEAVAGIPIQDQSIEEPATNPVTITKNKFVTKSKKSWVKKIWSKLEPAGNSLALAVVLAVLIPFLGIAVWQDAVTKDFWITLALTLLLYVPGLIYALSIILNDAR